MAKKKILKQKQKQKQSQRVVVNIDNSKRTTRRVSNQPPQPRQPQIIPIPYPIMQQPQVIQQPQFNRPVPQVPQANNNQVFENNFNRLNERLNNLSETFNTHAQNIMGRLNAQPPQTPVQTPPETPPTVELPRPQERRPEKIIVLDEEPTPQIRQPNQTPIIQGTRDLITSAKSAKIFSPANEGIPYEVKFNMDQQSISNLPKTLFTSPTVSMNPNGFNRPKQIHTTGQEFNNQRPLLIKNEPEPTANEQFNKQLEEADKKDIVEAEEEPVIIKDSKNNDDEKNKIKCPLCDDLFANTGNVTKHINRVHYSKDLKPGEVGEVISHNKKTNTKTKYVAYGDTKVRDHYINMVAGPGKDKRLEHIKNLNKK